MLTTSLAFDARVIGCDEIDDDCVVVVVVVFIVGDRYSKDVVVVVLGGLFLAPKMKIGIVFCNFSQEPVLPVSTSTHMITYHFDVILVFFSFVFVSVVATGFVDLSIVFCSRAN